MADENANIEEQPAEATPPEASAGDSAAAGDESAAQVADAALDAADQAAEEIRSETDGEQPIDLPDFAAGGATAEIVAEGLALLSDVDLNVKVELGRTQMLVEDVLRLNANSVIELDKLAGDPVDIYVNEQHIARGEVLVVNESFCVRVSEILQPLKEEED